VRRRTLRLLVGLEARRLADPFRHPRAGTWGAVAFAGTVVVGGLWLAADGARPDLSAGEGMILLGALVSGPVAFWAYPVLFRPADDGFLRRLGVEVRAVYALRALRLLALALGLLLLLMVPYAASGAPLGVPLAVALGGALPAWGTALWALSRAARHTVDPGFRPGPGARMMGADPDLVRAGPMVFAPILPLLVGAFAARLSLGAAVPTGARLAAFAALGAAFALAGARSFAAAHPRFAPRSLEMAYVPPPPAGQTGLVVGRGLAALLPRRAGAVRARDAAVVARRYRWAVRAVWPVSIVASLAVLRAGDDPAVRGWAAAAAALVLALQGGALLALGRLERDGGRWLDRAVGIRLRDRLLGRWAAGFGLSLGVVVPLSLAWLIVLPPPGAALWLAAGAGAAAVAAIASLALAGR
jgi:hypothetical protein